MNLPFGARLFPGHEGIEHSSSWEGETFHLRLSHVGEQEMAAALWLPLPKGELAARVRHPGDLPQGLTYDQQRWLRGTPKGKGRFTPFPSPLGGEIQIGEMEISYRCANEENCWEIDDGLLIWTAANPQKPILSVNSLEITIRPGSPRDDRAKKSRP